MDHHNFNIKGGDLHLIVGQNQTYFRIHSHFLIRESGWWRNELLGPNHSAESPLIHGTTFANAYRLRDESPEDFRHLLTIFYNKSYGNYTGITNIQWMPILRYAHKWSLEHVESLALRYLDHRHMGLVERIVFYQRNRIPKKYILPYYIKLASRPESLELEECRELGHMNYWFLAHARDALYARVLSSNTARSIADLDAGEIASIVVGAYAGTINQRDPTPGSSTVPKNTPKRLIQDVEDEDEGAYSETESWEDVDGGSGEKWEDLTIPGSFS